MSARANSLLQVVQLLDDRCRARAARNFELADEIKDRLRNELNILVQVWFPPLEVVAFVRGLWNAFRGGRGFTFFFSSFFKSSIKKQVPPVGMASPPTLSRLSSCLPLI